MEALPWFRMYTEFCVDPQTQMLSFEDQRHFVMAMCMKGRGLLDKSYASPELRARVIAMTLGLDLLAAAEANRRLREHGLVDEQWQPVAWERRQFKSDHDAAIRKRRSRERQRGQIDPVTTRSRDSHNLDTETDTDTDSEREARARGPGSESRPPGVERAPRGTSPENLQELEAWRSIERCNPEAMEVWIQHCTTVLDPPKVLKGAMRMSIARTIAGWGDFEQQLRAVLWCSANGFRNLRGADAQHGRADAIGVDLSEHLAKLREGRAA